MFDESASPLRHFFVRARNGFTKTSNGIENAGFFTETVAVDGFA
jgi:hypothetical protein